MSFSKLITVSNLFVYSLLVNKMFLCNVIKH